MELVALVFAFLFAIVRFSARTGGEVSTAKKIDRVGSWEDYSAQYCNRELEEKYKRMVLNPERFEEVWDLLEHTWDNEPERIAQLDERSRRLWELLMEHRRCPFFRVGTDPNGFDLINPRQRLLKELDDKYNLCAYQDEWGGHQSMYNWLRALHCLMTLHGKKSVDVANYEWAKLTCGIFNQPNDELWTYDGRPERAREKRHYGLDDKIEPLIPITKPQDQDKT